jgi:hypothetical protein
MLFAKKKDRVITKKYHKSTNQDRIKSLSHTHYFDQPHYKVVLYQMICCIQPFEFENRTLQGG